MATSGEVADLVRDEVLTMRHWFRTFDEGRDHIRLCGCGYHGVTGAGHRHGLGCAHGREVVSARYGTILPQPERQPCE